MNARRLLTHAFGLGLIIAASVPAGAADKAERRETAPSRYVLERLATTYGFHGVMLVSAGEAKPLSMAVGAALPTAPRDIMWDGAPELGYAALGQWAVPAKLAPCDRSVRIIERRGAIGGVQVRNFILPEQDMVVIGFTNRTEFDFGEIWKGEGFSHDLLAAVCPGTARK